MNLKNQKKIKIMVFTTLYPNHLQPNNCIFIHQRMKHVAKLDNCAVKTIAPIPYCPSWPFLGKWYEHSKIKAKETIEGIDVFHPRYPLIPKISMGFHGVLLAVGTYFFIKRMYKEYRFDLIDAHYIYPDGFAAILLGKLLNVPVVLTARGSDIHSFSELILIKPLIQWALEKSSKLISVCSALKNKMLELGVSEKKIHIISNGVATETFNILDVKKIRKKLKIDLDRKIILSVGSLTRNKGFHHIINAMPAILAKCPDALLYIIGEGVFRLELEKRIGLLRLQKKIVLVGEIENRALVDWYNAADVFCLASKREGWANVIMESLACGTPVVATNVWGAPEILSSSDVGLLVERHPEAIADKIVTALDSHWDKTAIREHVAQRSWLKVASEVESVFETVLGGGAGKSVGLNFDARPGA